MECTLGDGWDTRRQGWISVADGPVIKSVHGVDMQVTGVSLAYEPDGVEWEVEHIRVVGMRINISGKPGSRRDEVQYTRPDAAPEWVRKLIAHYRPKSPPPEDPVPFCILDVEE